jgi:tellurite resistance protein
MDDVMITISQNFAKVLTDYVGRLQNHDFSEAAMAIAAAIVWSDGRLDEVEQTKLEEFITTSPLLQPFTPFRLLNTFQHYSEMYKHGGKGTEGVRRAVLRIQDEDQQVLLLKFALVLAKADDPVLHDDEEQVIREFCRLLNIHEDEVFGEIDDDGDSDGED